MAASNASRVLPLPPGPSQCDEPAFSERVEHISELSSTPNKRIDRRRQVARCRTRAQRGEVTGKRRMHELPDTDLANVLEVMTAEIHRRDLGREPTGHVADEHLVAVTSRRHPAAT